MFADDHESDLEAGLLLPHPEFPPQVDPEAVDFTDDPQLFAGAEAAGLGVELAPHELVFGELVVFGAGEAPQEEDDDFEGVLLLPQLDELFDEEEPDPQELDREPPPLEDLPPPPQLLPPFDDAAHVLPASRGSMSAAARMNFLIWSLP